MADFTKFDQVLASAVRISLLNLKIIFHIFQVQSSIPNLPYLLMDWWIHIIFDKYIYWLGASMSSSTIGQYRPRKSPPGLKISSSTLKEHAVSTSTSLRLYKLGSCSWSYAFYRFQRVTISQLDPSSACITNMDDRLSLPRFPFDFHSDNHPVRDLCHRHMLRIVVGSYSVFSRPYALLVWPGKSLPFPSLHNHFHPNSYS